MDLSSLQNDLPRGKPSPPPSFPPPTLTTDFKAAALAVTKLYQNSARQIDNARQEGYLSAVQEVAALLSSGELAGDRLREWCAVGLSRITAQQDEENRSRHAPRTADDAQVDEDAGNAPARQEQTAARDLTSPANSPVMTTRMQFQNPFSNTEFTFQSPLPGLEMGLSGYSPPSGRHAEPEVTFEVIENGREGNGRKRGIGHQLGSIWDVGGNGGNKRSRHM
jgi:hypothetical protein